MKKKFIWIMVFFSAISAANAQPGFLDIKFGDSGKIIQSNAGGGTAFIQNDGKILTGSFRFFPDGKIDSGYGINGIAIIGPSATNFTLQNDSKMIFVGSVAGDNNGTDADISLQRLLPNGNPDSSFGDNSILVYDFGFREMPSVVQVAPDGKIVVAGNVTTNFSQNIICPFTARFMPDGSVDETYGQGGETIWTTGAGSDINAMLIDPNGEIIIGGAFDNGPSAFLMLRYDSKGLLDKDFGNDGVVITDLKGESSSEFIYQLALQKDGKIVAAGEGNSNLFGQKAQMTVIRYNINGSVDSAFGKEGVTFIKFDNNDHSSARSVAIQNNGKIVLSGVNYKDGKDLSWDFTLARLNADGVIDSSFGINGKQLSDFGGVEISNSVLIQADGKILSIGTQIGSIPSMIIARYLGNPTNPRPTIAQIKRWIRNHILHFEDANTNAAYYVIEKSTASNGAYVPVTKITANATTNNYSYSLPETATQSTYRIKAVNKDNSITYSSPISRSDPAIAGVASFKIYPNPAKERITVETTGTAQLRLQNSNGRVLLTQTVNGKGSIDISKLPNGIYYVVNTVNGESLKVVKE